MHPVHPALSHPVGRPWLPSRVAQACALLIAALAGACGGSTGSGGQTGVTGQEVPKPCGGTFFVDDNQSGGGANVHLADIRWGRLVNVHEVDANGKRVENPVFTDFVIEPGITSGTSYTLARDPITQRDRLTIKARKRGVADSSAFDQLLLAANDALPGIVPKGETASPPFTVVPRNACLIVRIDDCL